MLDVEKAQHIKDNIWSLFFFGFFFFFFSFFHLSPYQINKLKAGTVENKLDKGLHLRKLSSISQRSFFFFPLSRVTLDFVQKSYRFAPKAYTG